MLVYIIYIYIPAHEIILKPNDIPLNPDQKCLAPPQTQQFLKYLKSNHKPINHTSWGDDIVDGRNPTPPCMVETPYILESSTSLGSEFSLTMINTNTVNTCKYQSFMHWEGLNPPENRQFFLSSTKKNQMHQGVTPESSILFRIFYHKPSILGIPHDYGTPYEPPT